MPESARKDTAVISRRSPLFTRGPSAAILIAALIVVAGWLTVAADGIVTGRVGPSDDYRSGLLWKIQPPGRPPSYVFGTMHSEHPDVVNVPDPVQAALAQSERVILEMQLDPQTLGKVAEAMQIKAGPDLRSLVGPQLFDQAAQIMDAFGVPAQVLKGMKPWAVAVTLLTPPSNTGLFLDRVLYLEALARDKPVSGLETVQEQMAVFDELPLKEQIALLEESLELVPQLDALYAHMRKAYVARDLAALARLNAGMLEKADEVLADVLTRRLVTERNERMAERLETYLEQGNSFVAVGALHLPGDDGVLSLLAGRGYALEVVY
jgi:uncharacterized protein YbaP (TraB family)